jgi:hypothetical protein
MEGWRVGGLEGWRVGGLEGWRVGGLEGWRVGVVNLSNMVLLVSAVPYVIPRIDRSSYGCDGSGRKRPAF